MTLFTCKPYRLTTVLTSWIVIVHGWLLWQLVVSLVFLRRRSMRSIPLCIWNGEPLWVTGLKSRCFSSPCAYFFFKKWLKCIILCHKLNSTLAFDKDSSLVKSIHIFFFCFKDIIFLWANPGWSILSCSNPNPGSAQWSMSYLICIQRQNSNFKTAADEKHTTRSMCSSLAFVYWRNVSVCFKGQS